MKQLLSLFSSMKTMAVLMLIFAFAVGYATFIENDYGTMTAKADVYNAKWFEFLLLLLTINLMLNIHKYKMYTIKKAPIFIFHIAFIVILIGAAITRFVGFEGSMHIREGESSATMTSSETYFSVEATSGAKKVSSSEAVYLSKRTSNALSSSFTVDAKKVEVKLLEYIPDAIEKSVQDKVHGKPAASMMVTSGGKGESIILKHGEFFDNGEFVLDFDSNETFNKPVIAVYVENEVLFMKHKEPLAFLKMDDRSTGDLAANEKELFATRTLYTQGSGSFVLKEFFPYASTQIISNPNASAQQPGYDALRFDVNVDGVSKEVMIYGRAGVMANESHDVVNGVDVHLSYGAKKLYLPFEIRLVDFQLDRYPGSMSPSSYASEVLLIDKEQAIEMPYRIFMNNILEHRGYRFFQASYDQDEQGTVLSVNNDPGTLPSYIGYFLLALGMFWSLFSKENRFSKLADKAQKARNGQSKILSLFAVCALALSFAPAHAEELDPALKTILSFDKTHADKFGQLIVQDSGGRMKPVDTLATEILAKIHRSENLQIGASKLTPNQVVLGMMVRPDVYRDIKIIRTKDEKINALIGAKTDAAYASFSQFFGDPENMQGYKLGQAVEEASRKEPKHRDKFDKEVLKIDERVNVAFMVYTGSLVKIWPKQNDMANKWYATIEALQTYEPADAEALRLIAVEYFTSIDTALETGDWSKVDEALAKIEKYQKFYGALVYPSTNKVEAEVFYNKAKIFETIYPLYLLLGFLLLILSFVKILKPGFNITFFTKVTLWLLILFFIAHTAGLALRWYISGHAPWSNGYESMIYIGWATVLAGFIFSKRSSMTMASTGILAGLILFVAHLNWMDPQVTNLVPVLNSYWLSIHVSMITASYGFLGLGALLGFISLILFNLKNEKNEVRISLSIKELNSINEMSLMVGLVLLTVGNFLGGVWANESWGRYWGWDPKETWALVTILVYAVVLHLRFIKQIYNDFSFSVISLLAFTSVLMTYFGVNYYLAGLHSYAKGDPVPIPDFVPITYTIIFLIIALAYRNRKLV
ncbi:cytochrome c biogenesis protein CcsA [bacterium]|nr:cytochrome c biogenesis protein CcsA [bacterium]MBU1435510.1 cytochrome c biogenesis protein CcsA [bacterium]MBU1502566.1 cytochrome c biogenesis protein CcsA [bacterium]